MICASLVGLVSYIFFRNEAIVSNAQRAENIAQSAAAIINPDDFTQIVDTLEKNDNWHTAKRALDKIKADTDVAFLYVLDARISDNATYYMEGYSYNLEEDELDLGAQENANAYDDEMHLAIATGQPQVTDIYNSVGFGRMVSGFAPVKNGGTVVGVVGVDIGVDDVMQEVTEFGLRIIVIILIFCLLFGFFSVYLVNRFLGKPISQLSEAADLLAIGDVNVDISIKRSDEIGQLADSFQAMIKSIQSQIAVMEELANGNLAVSPEIRSNKDSMNKAIERTIKKLNSMFVDILSSAAQVSTAANQISQSSQMLASSSVEQTASIDRFAGSVTHVYEQSEITTEKTADAHVADVDAEKIIAESSELMNEMTNAMNDINQSSKEISHIIKTIDDIAFQTNILALNAAVEAARAGEYGKGFAVVADEVRNLASKSAMAAQETTSLIEKSNQNVANGNKIASATRESLMRVRDISKRISDVLAYIGSAADEQKQSISDMNQAVDQIAQAVQANSANAEESAASAEELAAQATQLNSIVSNFRLRDQR